MSQAVSPIDLSAPATSPDALKRRYAAMRAENPRLRVRDAARGLGVTLEEPFLQLAFLALPVIPALKITDRGMVDVVKFEIIS